MPKTSKAQYLYWKNFRQLDLLW